MTWKEVQDKYRKEAILTLGEDASEQEIEEFAYRRIVNRACSTSAMFDRIANTRFFEQSNSRSSRSYNSNKSGTPSCSSMAAAGGGAAVGEIGELGEIRKIRKIGEMRQITSDGSGCTDNYQLQAQCEYSRSDVYSCCSDHLHLHHAAAASMGDAQNRGWRHLAHATKNSVLKSVFMLLAASCSTHMSIF